MATQERTPLATTKEVKAKVGRPSQVVLYQKVVKIPLTGRNPKQLQEVAAAIHKAAASHELVVGGKKGRKVFVQKTDSCIPTKVFDGVA